MSIQAFNGQTGPIFVIAEATGPSTSRVLKLVLDTGATNSLIDLKTLVSLGFDPSQFARRALVTTGSTVESAPLVALTRLTALGQHRFGFPVIGHALPASAAIDGLLGLDFLRHHVLTIDFRAGRLVLS